MGKRELGWWIKQFFDPEKFIMAFPRYISFFRDFIKYYSKEKNMSLKFKDMMPTVHEKVESNPLDPFYFYQDIWAFNKIKESGAKSHVDIGSKVEYVGFLSTITKVTFIDIRTLFLTLKNYTFKKGSILKMPYADNSLKSISCLHVAEHIGLGRYGDPIDSLGTIKACRELSRVLKKGGSLYFSLPIGVPRICFNAHRIHSSNQILKYFENLELVEYSGIDDSGKFKENIPIDILNKQKYSCGLFHFRKK